MFFRCKGFAVGLDDDGHEGALRLLKRELQTSLLYYRDKLDGKGLACCYLRVAELDRAAVSAVFAAEVDVARVAMMDPSLMVSVNGRISGEQGDRTLQRLLPAIAAAAARTIA